MSARRYPLTALLEQRGALREQARRAVAEAVGHVAAAERTLATATAACAALAGEREQLARRLYDPDPGGLLQVALIERRSAELRNVEEREREAARALETCRAALASAEAELSGRRQALVEADRELQAAEKHHQAWRAEERARHLRREERESQEVVLARFVAEAGSDEDTGQGRKR